MNILRSFHFSSNSLRSFLKICCRRSETFFDIYEEVAGVFKEFLLPIFSYVVIGLGVFYIFFYDRNVDSKNLPTCPESEMVVIGYRNGKPMKICDQTYTFIAHDFNYSCTMTKGKEYGALVFARSPLAKDMTWVTERQAVSYAEEAAPAYAHCNFGQISPTFIQMGYLDKGDGSKLTHTQTMGF